MNKNADKEKMRKMSTIKLTWAGHSSFIIEADGCAIITDPFGREYVPGLCFSPRRANAVFCSHEHKDHNNRDDVEITGGAELAFSVTEKETFHDEKKGKLRGKNIIRVFEAHGMRIAHLGDLGCGLTKDEEEWLYGADCLLLPTGGTYTINAAEANRIAEAVKPRVIIPMHYRTEKFGFDVLETLEDFTKLRNDIIYTGSTTIEITKGMKGGTYVLVPGDLKK